MYAGIGVRIAGGCCGTTPDYIKEIVKQMPLNKGERENVKNISKLCSPQKMVEVTGVRVIGERITLQAKSVFSRR